MQGSNWEAARRLTREWLKEEHISAARLANRANVQRSVVSRFLNGQPITPQTAARLCDVMQTSLAPSERITLMEAFGLSRFSRLAGVTEAIVLPPEMAHLPQDHLFASAYIATRLWSKGLELSSISWVKAIPVFFEAERAFGFSSTGALAGLFGVQLLVNIGDFDSAEREIIRIETAYAGELDTLTRATVASLRGWIAFDRGDFQDSLKWFGQNLHLPRHDSLLHNIDDAHHFSARTLLEMSHSQNDPDTVSRMLHDAEQHLRLSLQMRLNRDAPMSQIGFEHLRLMEVLDAAGKHAEAREHRHKANEIFTDDGADLHILSHTAQQDLDEGDTRNAIKKGMAGLEGWRDYANGFARSAGIVAQGKLEEGKPAQALRYAALSHAFNPNYAHHRDRPRAIDLVQVAGDLVVHQQGRRKYDSLIRDMKEDVQARSGEFAHLARAPVDHTPAILALCDELHK